jgi:hypothetical protein
MNKGASDRADTAREERGAGTYSAGMCICGTCRRQEVHSGLCALHLRRLRLPAEKRLMTREDWGRLYDPNPATSMLATL